MRTQALATKPDAMPAAEVAILDEKGYPLIPHEELPFVDNSDPVRCGVKWGPVPTNYYDPLRYGRDMALALLRVGPQGKRTRTDDIEVIGATDPLEDQIAGRP